RATAGCPAEGEPAALEVARPPLSADAGLEVQAARAELELERLRRRPGELCGQLAAGAAARCEICRGRASGQRRHQREVDVLEAQLQLGCVVVRGDQVEPSRPSPPGPGRALRGA